MYIHIPDIVYALASIYLTYISLYISSCYLLLLGEFQFSRRFKRSLALPLTAVRMCVCVCARTHMCMCQAVSHLGNGLLAYFKFISSLVCIFIRQTFPPTVLLNLSVP